MSGWQTFEGSVVTMPWGRAVYTVLPVPDDVASALAADGARRVEGEINDHPVNLALTRAPVIEGVFLWAGRSLLDRLGVEPGETLEVRLRPAPDAVVDTPADIAHALREAGRTAAWETLTPGKRRGLVNKVETAKTAATRAKRIVSLVGELPE